MPSKTVIQNVHVFDGNAVGEPRDVAILDGIIGQEVDNATEIIDGTGCVLLPGLIESHCHPSDIGDAVNLTRYGVTTAFQLASYSVDLREQLKNHTGLVDLRFASCAAAAPGSVHGNMISARTRDPSQLVHGLDDAERWINKQLETFKPEAIKIVAQTPGLGQETLNRLVELAHSHGKQALCHAADLDSQRQATLAGVDQIHHMPADKAADQALADAILERGQVCVPTLSIMKALSDLQSAPNPALARIMRAPRNYEASKQTLKLYTETGIPVLAGTDANRAIAAVPFGRSLHDELQLMVEAGMSTLEVLRSVTSRPARHWGLDDRGVIAPGKRADLVLVEGDPIVDIKATRKLKVVWVAGVQYKDALGTFEDA